jgi:hypothetical protein
MERTASATWQEFVSAILLLCGNYLIKDLDCCLQANALIDLFRSICVFGKLPYNRLPGQLAFHHAGSGSAGGQVSDMPTLQHLRIAKAPTAI